MSLSEKDGVCVLRLQQKHPVALDCEADPVS